MEDAQFQNVDLNTLSHYIPTKRALYDILSNEKGLYLPAYTSQAINEEYLIQVMKNEIKRFLRAEIKICYFTQSHSKRELLEELGKACNPHKLGLTEKTMPDKEWLVNCLFHLKPDHSFFKRPTMLRIERSIPHG